MLGSAVLAALAAGTIFGIGTAAQSNAPAERYSANAFDVDRGNVIPIQIVVDRWSSDADRDRMLKTLVDKGADALLDLFQSAPKVGYIRSTTSLAWDLRYAHNTPQPDGGERVIVATDRPMSFWEAANQPRTTN